jgi:hypothetical protein
MLYFTRLLEPLEAFIDFASVVSGVLSDADNIELFI